MNISVQHIQSHIMQKWGEEVMSPSQLQTIAKRVFDDTTDASQIETQLTRLIKCGKSPWKNKLTPLNPIESVVFKFIKGSSFNLKELLGNKALFKHVFIARDPAFMKEIRKAVQRVFQNIWQSIQEAPSLSKTDHFHYETLIGDLLSFFTYQNAVQDEILEVPVRTCEQDWQMVAYKIDKLRLTPSWMGSPIVALGLKSEAHEAPPLLLFKGTTPPGDEGASLILLTDLNPGASIGDYAFELGKKPLENWLKNNTIKTKKAITFGASLGGRLAYKSALQFPDRISKAMAYSAPGFSFCDLNRVKVLRKSFNLPKIRLFCQYNDSVPYIDFPALKGVKYFEVLGEKIKKGAEAHTSLYSLHDKSAILRMSPKVIKSPWKRVGLTVARIAMSVLGFIPLLFIHAIQTSFRRLACKLKKLHSS